MHAQQDVVIQTWELPGEITFNKVTNAVQYRVEWSMGPGASWTNFAAAASTLDAIVSPGSGVVTASVPMVYRVVATVTNPPAPAGMVQIPGGTNAGTDPDDGAYSLTVDSFYMDKYEVSNDSMVEVVQWAYDQGKLVVTSASVKNAQGDQQELLDLDDADCRITWNGSSFAMKAA